MIVVWVAIFVSWLLWLSRIATRIDAIVLQHLGRGRQRLDSRGCANLIAKHGKFQCCSVLERNFHQCVECKLSLFLVGVEVSGVHDLGEVDELKVVEAAFWQVVVELTHHVPRSIPHAYKHDGQRVGAGIDDGSNSCCLLRTLLTVCYVHAPCYLPICDDDEKMVLSAAFLNDINRGVDDGRKRSGSSETEVRHNSSVPGENFLESFTRAVVGIKAEDILVMSRGITKSKAWNEVIIIEFWQRSTNNAEGFLVRVRLASDSVQAPTTIRILPCPFITLRKINAHNEIGRFHPSLTKGILHLFHRRIIVPNKREFTLQGLLRYWTWDVRWLTGRLLIRIPITRGRRMRITTVRLR